LNQGYSGKNSILIFSGTTEGRMLSDILSGAHISHGVCVVSEYGVSMGYDENFARVHAGALDEEGMVRLIKGERGETAFDKTAECADMLFDIIVDATHPYAKEAGKNIKAAAKEAGAVYLRLSRSLKGVIEGIRIFDDVRSCAEALSLTKGNILLTTGSKDLAAFCEEEGLRERLYVRVIPRMESLEICEKCGISSSHIIAMHGPFSVSMNEEIIRQYDITVVVSKQSGREGGFFEKADAAHNCGAAFFVIGAPEDEGEDMVGVCKRLEEITGVKLSSKRPVKLIFFGAGMADEISLTGASQRCLIEADVCVGSERLISSLALPGNCRSVATVNTERIIDEIKNAYESSLGSCSICLAFSGDVSFYSAYRRVRKAVDEAIAGGDFEADITVLPGISSMSYLAAKADADCNDVQLISMHGRRVPDIRERILGCERTFVLLSGLDDMRDLCHELEGEKVSIIVGYELGTEREQILVMRPQEETVLPGEGLYSCFIVNK